MTISIVTGWWLLPTLITIGTYGWAFWVASLPSRAGDWALIGRAIALSVCLAFASIVSLASWLIWALFR